jgi:hypothetical protein
VDAIETLLGFDARGPGVQLTEEYSSIYLLRESSEVLSVDTMLWPSAVEDSPAWIGMNAPFWEDLVSLERQVGGGDPYNLIAATWHARRGEERGPVGPYPGPTVPAVRNPSWSFLGYDVADPTISGLSNCGYKPEERRDLMAVWGPRLNPHHLFENLDHAFEFRALTDARVPEHAPFFVIGLWLIREVQWLQ